MSRIEWESAMISKANRERREALVAEHGEAAVFEMEYEAERLPLLRQIHNAAAPAMARDVAEGAQPDAEPRMPTWDEIKERLSNRIAGYCKLCRAWEIDRFMTLHGVSRRHIEACEKAGCKHPPFYFKGESGGEGQDQEAGGEET